MATPDRMAQQAQAKRAAAAKKKGSEGPKQSKPSNRNRYVIVSGDEATIFTLPKGVTPPKGSKKVNPNKPIRYSSGSPQASGVGRSREKTATGLKLQSERAKAVRRASSSYAGSEGPKRSTPRKKK